MTTARPGSIHDTLAAVLRGDQPLDALGPCALADVAMPLHQEALRILSLPQPSRRAEIERHPLAGLLAAEVKRVWEYRKNTCKPAPNKQ